MTYGELDSEDKVEIGRLATWSVSSAKSGHGIGMLRDNNLSTYWQSDGPQPHLVNLQFEKKTAVQQISFYYDFKQDESYTPLRISVKGGTAHHDLTELVSMELEGITGWVNINLEDIPGSGRPPRVFLLQLVILSNHLGGRDTHIRQLKLFSTREPVLSMSENEELPFTSPEFLRYTVLR
ncbi:anaphase-promoting complex subunit 10 [Gamsiella multidivaricata]|uniref:anaphase-promoting complex subunit 10 n=1 Tax=Gamsiella multidivaricata TaxID=101098 RepID=UPI00221F1906|nr:anaphase-promoting complex subunit 10 [Gamsiella multidivaricata]KAG0367277.1 Anaphase-promoting complex subunit 10 [Gamsiella multidivaricata]KAI7823864.1 anaphase-promoting complex subunit 10 [Gamsiella multidivaricata]